MQTCFQCQREIQPGEIDERWPDRCPHCGWGGGGGMDEADERYLVFLSLIHRAQEASENYRRLTPTHREFAMLNHGDQCRIDGVFWRITAKNMEKTVFYVHGWQVGLGNRGRLVTAGVDDDLEAAIKEQNESYVGRDQREQEFQERRDAGTFEPRDVDIMTPEDWETLSEEEAESLTERYESIVE